MLLRFKCRRASSPAVRQRLQRYLRRATGRAFRGDLGPGSQFVRVCDPSGPRTPGCAPATVKRSFHSLSSRHYKAVGSGSILSLHRQSANRTPAQKRGYCHIAAAAGSRGGCSGMTQCRRQHQAAQLLASPRQVLPLLLRLAHLRGEGVLDYGQNVAVESLFQ